MLMVPNIITVADAARMCDVSLSMIERAISDAEMLPVARLLTADGLWVPCYTVTAVTQALQALAESTGYTRGSGVAP
jgi:hypothetical protein